MGDWLAAARLAFQAHSQNAFPGSCPPYQQATSKPPPPPPPPPSPFLENIRSNTNVEALKNPDAKHIFDVQMASPEISADPCSSDVVSRPDPLVARPGGVQSFSRPTLHISSQRSMDPKPRKKKRGAAIPQCCRGGAKEIADQRSL